MNHVAKMALAHVKSITSDVAGEVGGTGVEAVADTLNPLVDRFNEVVDVPMLQGRLLEDIVVQKEVTTKIKHGLERKLRGWIVVKNGSTISLHDQQADNEREDQELWLFLNTGGTSETFKISLWVF
jgi:hypothetical protein